MYPSEDPVARLARRLKDLRLNGFAGQKITQQQLGQALNASTPLISSWESTTHNKIPPDQRLEAYAAFFATRRSVTGGTFRVLAELTAEERAKRDTLLGELAALRDAALGEADSADQSIRTRLGGLWHFPPSEEVTLVCAELPDEQKPPHADPKSPDYVRAARFADLDALLELFGHIRAANPLTEVTVRSTKELVPGDYTAHLAVLGGIDWNPVTADVLKKSSVPVEQLERKLDTDLGGFKVGAEKRLLLPEMQGDADSMRLESDIAHFYRGRNPFNKQRTVTLCNGNFGQGVLGAVRALTDRRLRDRNEEYVRERFADSRGFSILTRVMIVNGEVVTPDWTSPDVRLHEWQEEPRERASDSAGSPGR